MNEKQRKTILFAVLGVAIIWASFNIGKSGSDIPNGYELTTIQSVSHALSADSVPTGVLIDTSELMHAAWGMDPLRPMKTPKRQVAPVLSWKLTGIMYNSAEPIAYVNQKVVKVGDMIDKARVIKIEKQTVTLEYGHELITLTVSKG